MKRYTHYIAFVFTVILLVFSTSCTKDYYQVNGFNKTTKTHHNIAVLPVEMVFTGMPPMDLTEEDLRKQEEGESKAFQLSLHSELMRRKNTSGKGPHVVVQRISVTNELLEKNMTIRESWEKSPEELAQILGVDAVLQTRVEKKRYFSDLASYGIDVAGKILSIIAKDLLPFLVGKEIKKSNDIYAKYELKDGDTGTILWSLYWEEEADYKNPANQIIDGLNEKAAKRFPYKKKR